MRITRNPMAKAMLQEILYRRKMARNQLAEMKSHTEPWMIIESHYDGLNEVAFNVIEAALSAPDDAGDDAKSETQGEAFKIKCPKCGGGRLVYEPLREWVWGTNRKRGTCPRCQGRGTLTVREVKP